MNTKSTSYDDLFRKIHHINVFIQGLIFSKISTTSKGQSKIWSKQSETELMTKNATEYEGTRLNTNECNWIRMAGIEYTRLTMSFLSAVALTSSLFKGIGHMTANVYCKFWLVDAVWHLFLDMIHNNPFMYHCCLVNFFPFPPPTPIPEKYEKTAYFLPSCTAKSYWYKFKSKFSRQNYIFMHKVFMIRTQLMYM